MIVFWIVAAAMMAIAVAMILPPLLGYQHHTTVSRKAVNVAIYKERLAQLDKDEANGAQREQVRHEIERELIQDLAGEQLRGQTSSHASRGVAIALAVTVPIVSAVLYVQLGSRQALSVGAPPQAMAAQRQVSADHPEIGEQGTTPSLEEMVGKLALRLEAEPDNLEGWTMLGRSYLVMERYAEARDAFAHAHQLAPDNVQVLSRYAEAAALAQGGQLTGKPAELIGRLRELEPDHPNGLWLAGLAAFQQDNYRQAVEHWSRLAAMIGPGPQADTLAQYLAEARAQLGEPAPEISATAPIARASEPAVEPRAADTAAGASRLSVRVSLAPELESKASPSDTVFIFARAAQGPRMPLAIVQRTVAELPVSVTLDDSMAMTPAMKLSNFSEVVVGARISKSGNAMPQAGDLEGLSEPITERVGGSVNVTIDRSI